MYVGISFNSRITDKKEAPEEKFVLKRVLGYGKQDMYHILISCPSDGFRSSFYLPPSTIQATKIDLMCSNHLLSKSFINGLADLWEVLSLVTVFSDFPK